MDIHFYMSIGYTAICTNFSDQAETLFSTFCISGSKNLQEKFSVSVCP